MVRPLIPCGRCDRCLAGDVHLCEAGHGLNIGYGTPGAFAERVLVPRAIVGQTIFKLPDSVSDRRRRARRAAGRLAARRRDSRGRARAT